VLVFGFAITLVIGVGLLVALLVNMVRADRRATARLRGPDNPGGSLVRTVAGLLAREGPDRIRMFPAGVRGRLPGAHAATAALRGRHGGGS
jgi:hypothetical protein